MPNWVNNEMVITGPTKTLAAIKKRAQPIKDGKPILCSDTQKPVVLSFNQFVPEDRNDPNYQTGIENHCGDAFNWYQWRLDHWGCKWDASHTAVTETEGKLVFTFDSPWTPPDMFYARLARMYPDVAIKVYGYEEQGQYYTQKFCDTMISRPHWEWIVNDDNKPIAAKEFLELAEADSNVNNILDIVDLDKFSEECSYQIESVENIHDYPNASIWVDDGWQEDVIEWLNSATSNGKWSWDEDNEEYTYSKEA